MPDDDDIGEIGRDLLKFMETGDARSPNEVGKKWKMLHSAKEAAESVTPENPPNVIPFTKPD